MECIHWNVAGTCPLCNGESANTGKLAGMAKRGYSREFTPKTERRVRFEVDRIPPTLFDAVKSKAKRKGLSLRALTLTLWREWVERDDEAQNGATSTD